MLALKQADCLEEPKFPGLDSKPPNYRRIR